MLGTYKRTSKIKEFVQLKKDSIEKRKEELKKRNLEFTSLDSSRIVSEDKPSANKYGVNSGAIKIIHGHDFAPRKFYMRKDAGEGDVPYLGFELEVDGATDDNVREKSAKNVLNILGSEVCYIVRDGSLSGNGFEIVSHPQSVGIHKKNDYGRITEMLKENGYREDVQSAGLHIHINRNFFGDDIDSQNMGASKMMIMMDNNWNYVKKIARRNFNRYCQKLNNGDNKNSMFGLYGTSQQIGKYAMLNVQHKNTYEFRIFKGTLNADTLISSLEFVQNLAMVAKHHSIEECKQIKFYQIIEEFDCPSLVKFCEEHRIQY